jgi:small subunit ribosomal protein S16
VEKDVLKIRLRREGSRNHPFYRLVVSDSRNTPTGPVLETIGFYNPKTDPPTITVDHEKYEGWVKKGAHPSDSVDSLVTRAVKARTATA